jgi:hypothetical protein
LSLPLGLKHNEDAWPMILVHRASPTYIKVMSAFAAHQGSLYADYLDMLWRHTPLTEILQMKEEISNKFADERFILQQSIRPL